MYPHRHTWRSADPDLAWVFVSEGRIRALVREEDYAALTGALFEGRGCVPAGSGGRGGVSRFLTDRGPAILRRHRRGGWARRVLRNGFLFHNRPLRELRVHAYLYERGLAVPEPLGAAWQRWGPAFAGALATREIAGRSLLDYLAAAPRYPEDTLRRVGGLIREMHDLGAWHADLQVANVLVGLDRLYLIDFDKARVLRRVGRIRRAANLLRLRRSFDKNYLPLRLFDYILEGYGGRRPPLWLRAAYGVRGGVSNLLSGRRRRVR